MDVLKHAYCGEEIIITGGRLTLISARLSQHQKCDLLGSGAVKRSIIFGGLQEAYDEG